MSQDPDVPPRAPVRERPGLGHAGYLGVSEGSTHRPVSSGCEPGLSRLSCSGSRGGAVCLVVSGVSLGGPLPQDPTGPGWSIPALPGLAVLAYLPQSPWAPGPASSHSLGAQRLATDSVPTTPLPPASPRGVAGPPGFLASCTEPHSQACLGRWQGDLGPWTQAWGAPCTCAQVCSRRTPPRATSRVPGLLGHPRRVRPVSRAHRACSDRHISALAETPQCGPWAGIVKPRNGDSGSESGRPQAAAPTLIPVQPRSRPRASASPEPAALPAPALARVWGVHEARRGLPGLPPSMQLAFCR